MQHQVMQQSVYRMAEITINARITFMKLVSVFQRVQGWRGRIGVMEKDIFQKIDTF